MQLILRWFLRDWRGGELNVLLLALGVAIASVASVDFFADRVRQSLTVQASQLLGGDLAVTADQPLPPELDNEARRRGLRSARAMTLVSMARTGETVQLAGIRAVGEGYPLRGRLRIADGIWAAERDTTAGPAAGTAWVDVRFAAVSGARVGDPLQLGSSRLRIAAILSLEPAQGLSFINLAPRVLMHLDDLPGTGLIQPGSRASHLLYLAGRAGDIAGFRAWLEPRLQRGQRLQSLDDARPELRAALDRARAFLGLAALLAVVLAAVAIRLASQRYVERHYDSYAVLRCLGASQRRLVGLFVGQFLLLGAVAGLLGALLGFAAQAVIGHLLGGLFEPPLPPPTGFPALRALATGYLLLLGFALPPLLNLRSVPALRVLRRETGRLRGSPLLVSLAALATVAAIVHAQTNQVDLTTYALGGFAAGFVIFGLSARLALHLITRLRPPSGFAWRYAVAGLRRHGRSSAVQVGALAIALTAILLLAFTRGDLLDAWRARVPPDAPNRFILNIQPDQVQPLQRFFGAHGLPAPTLYPMVRGRLTAINGQPVDADGFSGERARRLVEREFNLSHASRPPLHNEVVEGRWFGPRELADGALSIEAGIAETLAIRLGDRLSWSVAGETFTAPVTNVRRLEWDSMQVNFFVITTPGLLAGQPASHITSFHLPAGSDERSLLGDLLRAFPNLTVIDLSSILTQVLSLTDKLAQAVQLVFLFALAAGILVLYTALLAGQDERVREAALMRALGASRRQVVSAQRLQHLAIGLLAGLLAAAAAALIGAILAERVFRVDYAPTPWLWLAGPLLGALCATANTRLATRSVLAASPMLTLRAD